MSAVSRPARRAFPAPTICRPPAPGPIPFHANGPFPLPIVHLALSFGLAIGPLADLRWPWISWRGSPAEGCLPVAGLTDI